MNLPMLGASIVLGGIVISIGLHIELWPVTLGGIIGGIVGCFLSFRD